MSLPSSGIAMGGGEIPLGAAHQGVGFLLDNYLKILGTVHKRRLHKIAKMYPSAKCLH